MSKTSGSSHQITIWIKNTIFSDLTKLRIQRKHIEQDRRWRNILFADVMAALKSGQVIQIRSSDQSVIWRGEDENRRVLELLCSMESVNGSDTLVIQEAYSFRVGTAYNPAEDDDRLKKEWLKIHSEYELAPDGKKVQRKLLNH